MAESSPIPLSQAGEDAITLLTGKGCDRDKLRVLVNAGRQTPQLLSTRKLAAIMRKFSILESDLEELRRAFDGWFLFPPLGQPTELSQALSHLEPLKETLRVWQDARKQKLVHPRSYWRLAVSAYVRRTTGDYHDAEVAALWTEVEGDAGNGGIDAGAVQHFRDDHERLLERFRQQS